MTIGDRSESPDVPASLVDEMRRHILSIAREFQLAVGHGLSRKVLFLRSRHLNPKQKELYDQALKSLVSESNSKGSPIKRPRSREKSPPSQEKHFFASCTSAANR